MICSLEKGNHLPDVAVVAERFASALALQDDPALAARLVAAATGARPAPACQHHCRSGGGRITDAVARAAIEVILKQEIGRLWGGFRHRCCVIVSKEGEVNSVC
jgi:hypothetical protein